MEKTNIAGHGVLVKTGTIEMVGNSKVTTHYSDFASVTFTDGEAIRSRVLAEGAISGLVSPDTSGRFVFAPWGKKRVLLAVDLEGRGLRVADPRYFSKARNMMVAMFIFMGLPFVGFIAMSLVFGGVGVVLTGIALLMVLPMLGQAAAFNRMAAIVRELDRTRQMPAFPETVVANAA